MQAYTVRNKPERIFSDTRRLMTAAAPHMKPQPARTHLANAIRALAMDAVERADSGHPGMPMGMADVATGFFAESLEIRPRPRNGRTATASCSRPGMAPCCTTRCCT